jgi:pimeloyl-ACP methyl ester carboxylesterase
MLARLVWMLALAVPAAAQNAAAPSVPYGNNPQAAHTLPSGDARIYYEVYGQGSPIVLLHGGLFGSIEEYADLIPVLAASHTVIAIDTRGHGKSQLGQQTMTYELITADFAAVIRQVTKTPVDVIGFSAGGICALRLATDHPDLVRRVVAIGAPLGRNAYNPTGWAFLDKLTPADLERLAPDFVRRRKQDLGADEWDRFVRAAVQMFHTTEFVSREKIAGLHKQVLLIGGDRDNYIRTEHFVEVYHLLPDAALTIVPGCGHVVLECNPGLMRAVIPPFLDAK